MATKPKAILSTHDGREASPITKASNVLFENGQTAQDILNDRQDAMISPVIENSSSMFKVGQGDDVDYSANVVNGAYEGMVLKGKTMVNCIQEPSSQDVVLPYEFEEGRYVTINDTKESGALGVKLKGQTLVNCLSNLKRMSHCSAIENGFTFNVVDNETKALYYCQTLKPNTEYTFFLVSSHAFQIQIGYDSFKSTGWNYVPLKVGLNKFTLKTSNDLVAGGDFRDAQGVCLRTERPREVISITNLIIIEGNHVDKDVPYFTGMTSCKMPTLHSVGKNLFNINGNINEKYDKLLSSNEPNIVEGTTIIPSSKSDYHHGKGQKIKIKKGGTYTCSFTTSDEGIVDVYGSNLQYCASNKTSTFTFTAPADCDEVLITFATRGSASGGKIYNFQIEEGSAATPYEPYKTSILTVNEEVTLRGMGDVKDTLDLMTGEVTERIGEIVLDGSENWVRYDGYGVDGYSAFITTIPSLNNLYGDNIASFISADFPTGTWNDYKGAVIDELVWNHDPNRIGIRVKNEKASNAEEIKTFLSTNNIRINYKLATPVVKTVDLEVVDQEGNVIPTLNSWNTTTHIYSEIPENSLYPILSHSNPTYPVILKPSTKYSIVANSYSNNHTNSAINFNLGGATASTTVGNRVTTITTPSTLTNEELVMSGRGNKLNNVMVIEGDVAGDLPYFEGICDCKSPILLNCGKNLFNCTNVEDINNSYTVVNMNNRNYITTDTLVEKGKQYTLSLHANISGATGNILSLGYMNYSNIVGGVEKASHNILTIDSMVDKTTSITFTAQTTDYIKIYIATGKVGYNVVLSNVQIEEGSVATSYEPYKTNILSCETYFDETTQSDKTIVLRSLPNGVCDTLNVETGEYVQRIGEIVLDGSEDEKWTYNGKYNVFVCEDLMYNKNYLSTHFLSKTTWNGVERFDLTPSHYGITSTSSGREYLSQNPITVQYELATPIVSTIDVQGFPHAYANGHIQLTSGSIEPSLTPKVEYSVATNRNGQIRSNQKMVERHQKQLDQLQAIILANLVNSQYNQTLTTLKYELSRV